MNIRRFKSFSILEKIVFTSMLTWGAIAILMLALLGITKNEVFGKAFLAGSCICSFVVITCLPAAIKEEFQGEIAKTENGVLKKKKEILGKISFWATIIQIVILYLTMIIFFCTYSPIVLCIALCTMVCICITGIVACFLLFTWNLKAIK